MLAHENLTTVIKINEVKKKKINNIYSESPESDGMVYQWFLYWKYIGYIYKILFELKYKILLNNYFMIPQK